MLDEFKHESLQDSDSIVRYLNSLSECFAKGDLVFGNEAQQMVLHPQGLLTVEIKARRKSGKVRLGIKFSWKEKSREKSEKGVKNDQPIKLVIESRS